MMLKRVEIHHFRSCHNVVLDNLGPVTVLAGRNAVGKTNILRAIQWAAETATSEKVQQPPGKTTHVSLEVVVGDTTYRYTLTVSFPYTGKPESSFDSSLVESLEHEDRHGSKRHIFQRQGEKVILSESPTHVSIGAFTPCIPALVSLMPVDSPVVNLIRPFLSILEKIRYYPLEADKDDEFPLGLVNMDGYDKWLARYHGTGDPGRSVLQRLLHMWLTSRPQFEEIVSLLGPNGLGLVDQIAVRDIESAATDLKGETIKWYWLGFQPGQQSKYFSFPLNDLSAGTQRIIRLIVSLIFDQSAVMLVEHPEDSIHRGLLRKLLGVLQAYSDQSQVIMSSHSSAVFDTLDPKAIRLVTMEEGTTKVRALTPEELHAAGRFMEEEGSLSDFIETVEED